MLATVVATSAMGAESVDFVRDVRPILETRCYSCHGPKQQKSGLRLDVKAAAFAGGELYGPSILPRDAKQSPLIQFVSSAEADLQMPPDGPRLTAQQIAVLARWVEQGAEWPASADAAKLANPRGHWSFQRVVRPAVPVTSQNGWASGPIDRFILARLEQDDLKPAPPADRVTWLRRVSFDLIGLPPTPKQVTDFVNDRRSDAFERVVDRLLHSPRYGERWAQHWLDVVRFADTHGFEVNTERPNAWPYRDYVIEAFNNDAPYDRFIREQIAGDATGADAATGFLVTASVLLPGQIGKDEPSKRLARQDAIDEIVVNIGQTFLGLSIGCARCHNHKFDPISQTDYYSMQAFVSGVEYADRPVHYPEAEAAAAELRKQLASIDRQLARYAPLARVGVQRPQVNARENIERFNPIATDKVRFTVLSTNNLEPCLDELEVFDAQGVNVALADHGTKASASGSNVAPNRHELRFVNDGQYGNSRSWMSNQTGGGWVQLTFDRKHVIDRVTWGRDRLGKYKDRLPLEYRIEVADDSGKWQTVADSTDRKAFDPKAESQSIDLASLDPPDKSAAERLLQQRDPLFDELQNYADGKKMVFAGKFRKPDAIHLLRRGDPEQPREELAPAVLDVLGSVQLPKDADEQYRRTTLADWIASDDNPLTARVMVNRIWQGHFGVGLVATPNDFGRNGVPPSHPELLDWLASEFVRSGWSIKRLHRLIVLSATYRQSARYDAPAATKDADVRLLWRYPTRRLEGELIRDGMLAIAGRLNLSMGGRGFDLFDKRGGLTGFKPVESFKPTGLRRMIYAHKVRRERDAVFGAFDCPDAGQSLPRRRESTTPIQALNLFNSRFVLDQSAAFAERVRAEVGDDVNAQICRAYRLALSRDPDAVELNHAHDVVSKHDLGVLCRVLLNSNEFLFIP